MKRVLVVDRDRRRSRSSVAAPSSLARGTTTAPGYNFRINVTITDARHHAQPHGRQARLARALRDHQQGQEGARLRHRRPEAHSRRRAGQGKLGAYLDDARPVQVQGRRQVPRILHRPLGRRLRRRPVKLQVVGTVATRRSCCCGSPAAAADWRAAERERARHARGAVADLVAHRRRACRSAGASRSPAGRRSARSRRRRSSSATPSTRRTSARRSTRSTRAPAACAGRYRVQAPNDGPNGLAVDGPTRSSARPTPSSSHSIARTGRVLWTHRLVNRYEQFVDIAPLAARGLVFTSTIGFAPGGRGALYALDQRTGEDSLALPDDPRTVAFPSAGGGGAWYPPSLAPDGRLYFGISNPGPWGGSPLRPNGGHVSRARCPYTDALVALDREHRQPSLVRPGDEARRARLRPRGIADRRRRSVFGAGKAGRVVAWNRVSGKRLWSQAVGTHLHDLGPLPKQKTTVCPGLWGGVLTPMAYAARPPLRSGRRTLHARELHRPGIPRRPDARQRRPRRALGEDGRQLWSRRLGSPATGCATVAGDVVFAPTLDGHVFALGDVGRTDALADADARRHQRLPERRGRPLARRRRRTDGARTRRAGTDSPTALPGYGS